MPKCLGINSRLLEITDVVRNLGTFTQRFDVNGPNRRPAWEGVGERSLRVEVHTNEPVLVIEGVARIVCKQFGQQAVMLEITDSNVQFLSAQ